MFFIKFRTDPPLRRGIVKANFPGSDAGKKDISIRLKEQNLYEALFLDGKEVQEQCFEIFDGYGRISGYAFKVSTSRP